MIWTLLNSILLLALALSFQPEEGPTKHYWLGLLAKFAASLSFGWYYFIHLQSGDTVIFHQQALSLYHLSEESFNQYINYLFTGHHPVFMAEGRNDFFVKILSLPYMATQGNYWLSGLYLAFFSFLCSWFLFRSIVRYFPHLMIPAFIAFLLWPTSLFWSSGILKDTLVNGSIFFLAGICIRYYYGHPFKFSQVTIALVCLVILFYLKFYLAAMAGICMGILAWDKVTIAFISSKTLRYASMVFMLIVLMALTSLLNWNMNLDNLPQAVADNYLRMKSISEPDKIVQLNLDGTYASLIKSTPMALVTGLWRPAIWQTSGWMIFFGMESLFIYLLFPQAAFGYKRYQINLLGMLTVFFIISLSTFLPMVSPNLGSLVRYKSVFIPFLLFILLIGPYLTLFVKNKQIS